MEGGLGGAGGSQAGGLGGLEFLEVAYRLVNQYALVSGLATFGSCCVAC